MKQKHKIQYPKNLPEKVYFHPEHLNISSKSIASKGPKKVQRTTQTRNVHFDRRRPQTLELRRQAYLLLQYLIKNYMSIQLTILLDKHIFFILDFLAWCLECRKILKHYIIKMEGLTRNEIDDGMWTKILIQMKGMKNGTL